MVTTNSRFEFSISDHKYRNAIGLTTQLAKTQSKISTKKIKI
ncbi:hypothetical protein SAMN03080602_01149 [Arenibacter troitsensis]|uniref:Uncharacterized protein n=1 Tax=Arenibacter troitsensis TaxID=188872 RepID=A0A1X7IV28_9FLAO|nr:hypothetical protein SAMN03080602_01149 [Arenibacter troitsensis]